MAIKKNFHHGDLRAEMLRLAQIEIETVGYEALSLRALASRLGVSKTAPYHHFPDRRSLLLALAQQGLEHLRLGYAHAMKGRGSAAEKLRRACLSYLDFAARKPQLYRLIFVSGADWQGTEDVLLMDSESSFGLFEQLVMKAAAMQPGADARAATLARWAALHGFAMFRSFAMSRVEAGLSTPGEVEAVQEAMLCLISKPTQKGRRNR